MKSYGKQKVEKRGEMKKKEMEKIKIVNRSKMRKGKKNLRIQTNLVPRKYEERTD